MSLTVERHTAETRATRSWGVTTIIATAGQRPAQLAAAVASVDLWPGDELLVVRRDPPGGDWGHTERNEALPRAQGGWLSFLDDDDVRTPGARAAFAAGIMHCMRHHLQVPIIYRMRYPDGRVLWRDGEPQLRNGNVGTPMMLVPNVPAMLAQFGHRFEGDFDFLESARWPRRQFLWREDIVAELGH